MQHLWSLAEVNLNASWLTIGSFDGVHLGHREIIRRLTVGARSEGVPAVVLTFFPHPAVVLGKRKDPFYLSTPEEKAAILGDLGVDYVITHPFNPDIASMTAREFIDRLNTSLSMQRLIVGHDFALGRGRQGDVPALTQLGEEFGYYLEAISPLIHDGKAVSSSRIRELLAEGDVRQANRLLGRPYRFSGVVKPGDGRGRTVGIPTANLTVWGHLIVPATGVYVCRAEVAGKIYQAVTNIGVRPTFKAEQTTASIEAHLLDFNGDLYDTTIGLTFIERLRGEKRFSGVQELVQQIHRDIDQARRILNQEAA
jgi:riboflavin kinase / FMN adenylyltransferase